MKQNFGVPLSRNEMKNVMGGYVDAGTCQAQIRNGSGDLVVVENLSSGAAQSAYGMVHWCCSQCCTASWSYKDNC